MKTFNYDLEEATKMVQSLESKIKMTTAQINFNYLIKVHGQGLNQLVGVTGLCALVGADRAAKMLTRANACVGDVCKCRVYGQDLQVSFYIH